MFNLAGEATNGASNENNYFYASSHHFLVIGSAFIIFVGFLNWIPTIWINLLPSLILWFPFLQKIRKMKYDPYYLTRFEVTNYLYVLLWLVRETFVSIKTHSFRAMVISILEVSIVLASIGHWFIFLSEALFSKYLRIINLYYNDSLLSYWFWKKSPRKESKKMLSWKMNQWIIKEKTKLLMLNLQRDLKVMRISKILPHLHLTDTHFMRE